MRSAHLVFLAHRCRHSTPVAVDCLLLRGAMLKTVLISGTLDEIEVRPDIPVEAVAVWPADPRGRRGGCEPAGKTCYLPRFHIML
jgi:hypothetical protein